MSDASDAAAARRALRTRHPGLGEALRGDAEAYLRFRGDPPFAASRGATVAALVRLAWTSDAFLGQALYRLKASLQARGVPVLPRLAHRLAVITAQVSIGDPVLVAPGLYLAHGQVVIDGITEIGAGVTIAPFVTVGLRAGDLQGPTIEAGVSLGAGCSVIGPVRIGPGARVGAGAVVVDDVPAGATVAGVPARPVDPGERRADG